VMKAVVVSIETQQTESVALSDVKTTDQSLQVKVLDGDQAGQTITAENGTDVTFKAGDVVYLTHDVNQSEDYDTYYVSDAYRMPWIYGLAILFIICVLLIGGKQGFRGLIALVLSFIFIGYLLFPGILHGFSPLLVSVGVASLMVILGSYITHGFNRVTSSAVIGMVATILVTSVLALVSIHGAKLTGFSSEESVYLNFDTNGTIDFAGLLFGGILIGLLGVLYDAAIGQAVAVDELHGVAPHLSRKIIFSRALRIGREHIGALVNILAIAYVGASLPLLLLFYNSGANFVQTVNQEVFATEIIRTMVGSIGLVLAVPVTTFIAVLMLIKRRNDKVSEGELQNEREALEHFEHKH
jgi:uncharacterized membrane protein